MAEKMNEHDVLVKMFVDAWEDMDVDDKIGVHNLYCENNRLYSEIHRNGDDFLNENFKCPSDAVTAVTFGAYNYNDKYVWFDGYGNLSTASYDCDLPFDDEEYMAKYFIDNYDDLSWWTALDDFREACEFGVEADDEEEEEEE